LSHVLLARRELLGLRHLPGPHLFQMGNHSSNSNSPGLVDPGLERTITQGQRRVGKSMSGQQRLLLIPASSMIGSRLPLRRSRTSPSYIGHARVNSRSRRVKLGRVCDQTECALWCVISLHMPFMPPSAEPASFVEVPGQDHSDACHQAHGQRVSVRVLNQGHAFKIHTPNASHQR
jgi:hypothetical protein